MPKAATRSTTTKSTDEALVEMTYAAVEIALEDGGSRAFVGETIGLPRLATADYHMGPDGVDVIFDNGDQYRIEVTVRAIGSTAELAKGGR